MFTEGMNPTRAVVLGICAVALFGVLVVGMGGRNGPQPSGEAGMMQADGTAEAADVRVPAPVPSMRPSAAPSAAFDDADDEASPDGFDPVAHDPQAEAGDGDPIAAVVDDGPAEIASANRAPSRPDKSTEE